MLYRLLCAVVLITATTVLPAQDTGIMQQVAHEEQEAIKAIALYPLNERIAILEIAKHPEILVRMDQIRARSQDQFRDILDGMDQGDQAMLYNLSRYPELVEVITENYVRKPKKQVAQLATGYPEGVAEDAVRANQKYFDLLVEMNSLYQGSQSAAESVLAGYPAATQDAFRTLLELPEVLEILTGNMNLTVLLGDEYSRRPDELMTELDSLNTVVAEEKSRELNDWKQALEEDTAAMREYEQATREFAEEQGYDNSSLDRNAYPEPYTNVHVSFSWRPYPYWFGWPYWYSYPYWYPYPWWYHCGYYYGTGGVVVFFGMPSNFYMHWHFTYYHHLYYYPHFTNKVIDHYYGPRNHGGVVTAPVRDWTRQNSTNLTGDWMKDDGLRADRIREYGKFNMDYHQAVSEASADAPTPREFLKKNANQYPSLKPVLKEPTIKPLPTIPNYDDIYRTPKREPSRTIYKPAETTIERNKVIRPDVDKAKTYHENTWTKVRKTSNTSPVTRQPSPSVRTKTTSKTPKMRSSPNSRQSSPSPAPKTPRKKD